MLNRDEELDKMSELEKLVDQVVADSDITKPTNIPPLDDEPDRIKEDFGKIKDVCREKATKTIKMLVKFYLTVEMVENPYTQEKIGVDVQNLTNLIWQMDTSQYAIQRTLEEIDESSNHVGMYRALSDLQKGNLEILKFYKQYMQVLENEYSDFPKTFDRVKQNLEDSPKSIPTTVKKDDNIYRGSKDLIAEIQEEANLNKINQNESDTSENLDELDSFENNER